MEQQKGTTIRDRLFQIQNQWKKKVCIYCDSENHRTANCGKIIDVEQINKII